MYLKIITPQYFMLNCKYIVPHMTYELYLIDILNSSTFFRNKSPLMEHYKPITEQSNGEADAYTSTYQLDFKLLIDEDVIRAYSKNKPVVDYSRQNEGFIFVKTAENPVEIPKKNVLHDISTCKYEDLINKNFSSRTIEHFAKNLKKDKNLFFYYPYEYSTDKTFKEIVYENLLNNIFKESFQFRSSQTDCDTFICIKVNLYFLIFEWCEDEFIYRDKVHEIECSNYIDAKLYSLY